MERVGEARAGTKRFRVQLVVFGSGERSNILVDCRTELPVFHPTVWTISRYRARSAATVEQALRAASLVHIFCEAEDIDLDRRLRDGTFLSILEVERLVALARRPMAEANDPRCTAMRPELTNWLSGTHKRTKLEHGYTKAQAGRAFRLFLERASASPE